MKNFGKFNLGKFKLFHSRPILSITATVIIIAACYFIGVGRFSIGIKRYQTPTTMDVKFSCLIGGMSKTFILQDSIYTLTVTDQLEKGDLRYTVKLDGEELFVTADPTTYTIDGLKGVYSVHISASKPTKGSFNIKATKVNHSN